MKHFDTCKDVMPDQHQLGLTGWSDGITGVELHLNTSV